MKKFRHVLVIGGAGYIGAVLVPELLKEGYRVTVYDLFIYGQKVFDAVKDNSSLKLVRGDVRDLVLLEKAMGDSDAVIHLACISNDPSFELNPELSKSINYDCFEPCVKMAKAKGVKRFIYASSSSVYGIKDEQDVTEDMSLKPLTDYSRYKVLCEEILLKEAHRNFTCVVLRPATACGYSPRQRLDLTVNILTNQAVNEGKIRVLGGEQKRPGIHIRDLTDLYVRMLEYEDRKIEGNIFNVGYENHTIIEIARMVKEVVGKDICLDVLPADDERSYHISSDKIKKQLGFTPEHSIKEAAEDLKKAFEEGLLHDPLNNTLYYNIRRMKEMNLK